MKRFPSCAAWLVVVILLPQAGCSHLKTPQFFKRQPSRVAKLPPAPKITAENAAQVQLAMARSLERKGHLQRAADAYERIIDDHDLTSAYHRLAVIRDRQGSFDASADLFEEALRREPQNSELLCDIGYSQYIKGNNQKCEEALLEAIRVDPDLQRAHNNLALLHTRQQHYDRAVEEFAVAAKSYGTAHLNVAYALALNGNMRQAHVHAKRAVKLDAKSEKAQQLVKELSRLEAQPVAVDEPMETEAVAEAALAEDTSLEVEVIKTAAVGVAQDETAVDAVATVDMVADDTAPVVTPEPSAVEPALIRTPAVSLGEPLLEKDGVMFRVSDRPQRTSQTNVIRFISPL